MEISVELLEISGNSHICQTKPELASSENSHSNRNFYLITLPVHLDHIRRYILPNAAAKHIARISCTSLADMSGSIPSQHHRVLSYYQHFQ